MIELPSGQGAITKLANELVDQCRNSSGSRAAYYRQIHTMAEMGRSEGSRSLINMLYSALARSAAHLFSPIYLRFTIDFENSYPQNFLDRATVAAKGLTRDWSKNSTDMMFSRGVFEGLKYGAAFLKQWPEMDGDRPTYNKRLVMPWQFGVYREDETELAKQEVLVETTSLTMPEVWRRIYHLPDAKKLYERIKGHSSRSNTDESGNWLQHQVLSTSQINTSGVAAAGQPGGLVNIGSGGPITIIGTSSDVVTVKFHELWVKGERDYVTIQLIEPDILIAPLFKHSNLLIPGSMESRVQPYTLIQPNQTQGNIWGRSELADLMSLQSMLSVWADDIQRLFGVQVDKILGFSGFDGLTDEIYDSQRAAGYVNAPLGAQITDLTPKFPQEAIPMLKLIMEIMNQIGGFPPIMQGQGDAGVRAGTHADTLLKTASPSMRDRSLLVERQCAMAADLTLKLKTAKDGNNYWTDGSTVEAMEKTKFTLMDIPKDRQVSVDSHSSSPIFADDHEQLVAFGLKSGYLDGDAAIDMLPYPEKDKLHAALKQRQQAAAEKQKMVMEKYPEEFGKAAAKKAVG